jgi:hypothetical protein
MRTPKKTAAQLAREAADAAQGEGNAWFCAVTLVGAAERLLALGDLETAERFFAGDWSCSILSATSSTSPSDSPPTPRSRRSSAREPLGSRRGKSLKAF